MKVTDFAILVGKFLSKYLPEEKNASLNTIASYRDMFKLFLSYALHIKGIAAEKMTMSLVDKEFVVNYLGWLETNRQCSTTTRNQRLAALHSFFRFVQYEMPEGLPQFQAIQSIPTKKAAKAYIPYLTTEAVQAFLACPDRNTRNGRRHLTLIALLYDSACRVQELADLTVRDLIMNTSIVVITHGKGQKARHVPITQKTGDLLRCYVKENHLDNPSKRDWPLFVNKQHNKLTKEGIAYIVNTYALQASNTFTNMPKHVTPHMLRHSKAMHLLQAGVNLIYIRDFLGHESIKTTEIYAKCDTEQKRKAIENAYPDLIDSSLPDWCEDNSLIEWLNNLPK